MWGVPYVWTLRFLMFEIFEHSYFGFVSKPGTRPQGGESKRSADNFDIRISYLLFLITA